MDNDNRFSEECITIDQLQVIHDLLLKSPPGELYIVLEEIKDILGGKPIPRDFLATTLRECNITQTSLVDVTGSRRSLLIVGSLEDESDFYLDVINHKCFQYNHLNNSIISELEYPEQKCNSDVMQQLRDAIIQESDKYLSHRFINRSGLFVGVDGDHIDIVFAGEIVKLSSFYSGRWVSRYSLDYIDGKAHLVGAVDINTHYFENGNIRMTVHRDKSPVSMSISGKNTAADIFKGIAEFEDSVQNGLQNCFASMKQDTLKEFRRQLPRTHQFFTWNVNAHKMTDMLREIEK